MSQEKAFGEKSDSTLWISLAVGFLLIGALAAGQWASAGSEKDAAKSASSVQAKKSAEPVYRCADGRISFTPCSK